MMNQDQQRTTTWSAEEDAVLRHLITATIEYLQQSGEGWEWLAFTELAERYGLSRTQSQIYQRCYRSHPECFGDIRRLQVSSRPVFKAASMPPLISTEQQEASPHEADFNPDHFFPMQASSPSLPPPSPPGPSSYFFHDAVYEDACYLFDVNPLPSSTGSSSSSSSSSSASISTATPKMKRRRKKKNADKSEEAGAPTKTKKKNTKKAKNADPGEAGEPRKTRTKKKKKKKSTEAGQAQAGAPANANPTEKSLSTDNNIKTQMPRSPQTTTIPRLPEAVKRARSRASWIKSSAAVLPLDLDEQRSESTETALITAEELPKKPQKPKKHPAFASGSTAKPAQQGTPSKPTTKRSRPSPSSSSSSSSSSSASTTTTPLSPDDKNGQETSKRARNMRLPTTPLLSASKQQSPQELEFMRTIRDRIWEIRAGLLSTEER